MIGKIKPEILNSISILDSEKMIDETYNSLLALIEMHECDNELLKLCVIGGYRDNKLDQKTYTPIFGTTLVDGIYIPAVTRNYLYGTVDIKNDILPERGSVIIKSHDDLVLMEWATIIKKKFISKKDAIIPIPYKDIHSFYVIHHIQILNRDKFNAKLIDYNIDTISFACISKDGNIYPVFSRFSLRQAPDTSRVIRNDINSSMHYGCGAISLLSDRQYLWLVETKEKVSNKHSAIVQFGVDSEIIKSLFYARSQPLTESGRKRPILHWVREHQRRIKSGIDIDISKFLRGITEFKMENINFKITQPIKKVA
jgi:hypothetical protein